VQAALRPAWDEPEREPVLRIALSRLKRRRSIAAPGRPRVEFGNERSAERTSAALRPAWDEPERYRAEPAQDGEDRSRPQQGWASSSVMSEVQSELRRRRVPRGTSRSGSPCPVSRWAGSRRRRSIAAPARPCVEFG